MHHQGVIFFFDWTSICDLSMAAVVNPASVGVRTSEGNFEKVGFVSYCHLTRHYGERSSRNGNERLLNASDGRTTGTVFLFSAI